MKSKALRYYGIDCDIQKYDTEEEWLKNRKYGITGTDVASIAGVNKYSTAIQVYLDKMGELEKLPDNDFMYWGRMQEPLIAKRFAEETGFKIQNVNCVLKHKENSWALGSIDRLITNDKGEKGILEIKTVSEYVKGLWEGEEVPISYMIQLQWYMYVTNTNYGYFAALIGGNKYIQKYVERDNELIDMLVDISKSFWFENVLKKIPPMIDGSEASTNIINKMYPSADENTSVELNDEALKYISRIEELKVDIKALEEEQKYNENQLKDLLKENEIGMVQGRKIIWKNQSRTSIDSKKLKTEQPELFKKYSKTSSYRKFEIK